MRSASNHSQPSTKQEVTRDRPEGNMPSAITAEQNPALIPAGTIPRELSTCQGQQRVPWGAAATRTHCSDPQGQGSTVPSPATNPGDSQTLGMKPISEVTQK